MTFFLDAHEDLAYNMAAFQRNYLLSAAETRRLEAESSIPAYNGDTLLGWPEYNQAKVGFIFATCFATPQRRHLGAFPDSQVYTTSQQAHQLYTQQLESYHRLCDDHPEAFRLILSQSALTSHLSLWQQGQTDETALKPVGIVPLMEGAEGVLSPAELPEWWQGGLRLIGPAWAGNQYCGGTRETGPLTPAGRELLEEMAEVGFILDLSHMDEQSAFQSLDSYPGTLIYSHANASALVKGYRSNRLLSDELIAAAIERGVVIGVTLLNSFLNADWVQDGGRSQVSLRRVAEQIDHICQIAGDAGHVGLGTDFDGGFGLQSAPIEIDTIADLPKLNSFLIDLGFSLEDLEAINSGNFLHVIQSALPAQD